MARQALTLGGFIVGAAFGAPTLGFAIGSILGNAVDPIKSEGPRLTDAKAMVARDGVPIPWGDGIFRVAGTMIACQPGKPTEHKKKKRQGKGGGPVQVTYTYTRSHAVLICEGPIVGIRRIWRNEKLVWDATPIPTATDFPSLSLSALTARIQEAIASKASSAKFSFTLYLGDETQLPDPTLEAMFGVGEVGANRGIAYIVVEDDDVTDSGGAVPQYEFEVARAGVIDADTMPDPVAYWPLSDSLTTLTDTSGGGHDGTRYSPATRENPISRNSAGCMGATATAGGWVPYNSVFDVGSTTSWAACCSFVWDGADYGGIFTGVGHTAPDIQPNFSFTIEAVTFKLIGSFNRAYGANSAVISADALDADTYYRAWLVRDGVWLRLYLNGVQVGEANVGSDVAYTGATLGVSFGDSNPSDIWLSYALWNFGGKISDCGLYAEAISASLVLADYEKFRSIGAFDFELPDSPGYYVDDRGVYVGSGVTFESIATDTVTLDEFISTICLRCGLEASDIDVSDVVGIPVTGYFIARQAGGDACLKPLLDAFQIGMYEADGKIWFVQLGADTVADLDADDLVALDGPPVTETRAQEIELPRKINVVYSDPETAYTPTKQTSERVTSDVAAVGEVSIELPIVMTADQAAQIAHKKEKAAWIGLLGGKDFVLPDEFSYLTPTDNINLTYRGRTERVRLEKVDAENGQLMLSTQQDRQSAYSSERTGTSPEDFFVADTLVGPTIWNVMNLPQLRPQDNVPGVYFACCGLLEGWRGCELQMTVDGGVSWVTIQQYDQPSAIGYLASSITDSATTATVTMYGTGELESVTSTQEDAGSNRAAIVTASSVTEVVSFEDAALDSFGDYDLAAMSRALLGTTAAAHAGNERFVQLDNINFVPIDSAYAGQAITFRAVSLGTVESNNGEQTLMFSPAVRVIDGGGA